eukprot:11958254-Ditylum_brightwellii.AAC.1
MPASAGLTTNWAAQNCPFPLIPLLGTIAPDVFGAPFRGSVNDLRTTPLLFKTSPSTNLNIAGSSNLKTLVSGSSSALAAYATS